MQVVLSSMFEDLAGVLMRIQVLCYTLITVK